MSEMVADQIGGLLRRIARQFNRKVSEILMILINNKSAGSLGALAGFAIAIVFTWKLFRPAQPRRNRPKRRRSPSSSRDGDVVDEATASSSEDFSSGLKLKDSDAMDGVGSAVELTLKQVVRRKLSGCRKITCQLLGVILEERTPEELQKHATVRFSVVEVLLMITKYYDLYLMERILDDESEERVLSSLDSAGLFQNGGLNRDKVLFCSTEVGRSSFVRQLEADWHVDTNPEIISQLSRFIKNQLHISSTASGQLSTNVFTSTSLEQYFSCL